MPAKKWSGAVGTDLDLPPEGVRPRASDPPLGEVAITKLFTAAAIHTEDLADQARIVALCVVARLDHNDLRRRIGAPVIPDRPPEPERAHIQHHNRSTKGFYG